MKKIIVVGGGASGLVSSIFASKEGNSVTILEKNSVLAKKILVTGNGRCNYWNSDLGNNHYHGRNLDFIKAVNTLENRNEVLKFLEKIGVVPMIKDGYYYPYSNQAVTIKEALINEALEKNVMFKTNYEVKSIEKCGDKFVINDEIYADSVIIATGSLAYYKDDNSFGYDTAFKFGHNIIKVLPSLVQLKGNERYFKDWAGIRSEACVSLYVDDVLKRREFGEVLLTDYGISGICVFNVSGIAAISLDNKRKVTVHINFASWCDDLFLYLENRSKYLNRTIDKFLEGFLNYKLVYVILDKARINKERFYCDLSVEDKKRLCSLINDFSFDVIGTNSYDKAQVCSGGVDTLEIDCSTMESLIAKGLYFAGEVIDVDGDCGGYNLSFAFMSGMIAGKNAGDNYD